MIRKGFLTDEERRQLLGIARDKSEIGGFVRRANAILLLDKGWSMHSHKRSHVLG